MREKKFAESLINDRNIVSRTKAVRSKINKCKMTQRHFEGSLDLIVNDDDITYRTLVRIKEEMKDTNGNILML